MVNKMSTRRIIVAAFCIIINIVGGFLALALRLPIYLDTIGTIFGGVVFGPVWAVLIGLFTGIINGITFDPVSLYYIPVQIVIGLLTGFFFKKHVFDGFKSVLAILIITLAGSVLSSIITTFVFSGITSSGSSYVVAALRLVGLNIFTAVFSTQFLTDLLDKSIAFLIVFLILKVLPKSIIQKLEVGD